MNERVNSFPSSGDKFMPLELLQKIKKKYKNLKKYDIQDIFIKTNWIKFST